MPSATGAAWRRMTGTLNADLAESTVEQSLTGGANLRLSRDQPATLDRRMQGVIDAGLFERLGVDNDDPRSHRNGRPTACASYGFRPLGPATDLESASKKQTFRISVMPDQHRGTNSLEYTMWPQLID